MAIKNRNNAIIIFMIISFFLYRFTAEGNATNETENVRSGPVLQGMKSSIDIIENNINFLASKHVDVKKLRSRFNHIKLLYEKLSVEPGKDDLKLNANILNLEINNILSESKLKVASFKRFNLLSRAMLIFGFIVISVFVIFYIVYFSRDK